MKPTFAVYVLVVALLAGIAPSALQAEVASSEFPDYTVIKGGYYYPSEEISLDEFSDADFERENGYTGEIAFGHYYAPVFGMELGVGYFQTRRFPGSDPGRVRIEALPVLLSAKLFLPIGPIEPYGELGVGAYFSKLEVDGPLDSEFSYREVDYGPHAGVGININLTDSFYLGLEGRYRKVKPSYDGREVRLDGYTATVNLGFRH